MVEKPNTPMPAAPTGLEKNPTKIEPPKQVSGEGSKIGIDKDVANKDRGSTFKLPDKVSQKDILEGSFKYGGGRSSGNRSLEANREMQKKQP